MKKIVLTCSRFKGKPRIFLKFEYDDELISIVKKLDGACWSGSLRVWHIKDSAENMKKIEQLLHGIAEIEFFGIKKDRMNERLTPVKISEDTEIGKSLRRFNEYLTQKRYSKNTIKVYNESLGIFLAWVSKDESEINNSDINQFNTEYILGNNYGRSYQNQIISAIKLYFSKFRNKEFDVELLERPRKKRGLPNVLSKEEVKRILEAPVNIKHKAMLSLIYACGLRCGELLSLRPQDIDSKRELLRVWEGKGMKDRFVPLSGRILVLLRTYYISYRPVKWLFEGSIKGNKYSSRSLQQVLKAASRKAGIKKPVTLHWLRHSYATHLLENGVNLRYIQEILGHSSSKTTEIYTHVSNREIRNIKSPFEDL